ncbi:hypothetical protein [Mixta sp.]|uniref:hypothetical protein n=1 Tax=Mixta sp. TaxID=2100765 RepID=UPI00258794CD|nr:hypothetical protein [Mixta sp.]MCR1565715.1 hypothetical protein [Mixta sp.]
MLGTQRNSAIQTVPGEKKIAASIDSNDARIALAGAVLVVAKSNQEQLLAIEVEKGVMTATY